MYLYGLHVFNILDIIIISGDGWSWLQGLVQLQVKKLHVFAACDLVVEQLAIVTGVLGNRLEVEVVDDLARDLCEETMWCMHFGDEVPPVMLAAALSSIPDSCKVFITCHPWAVLTLQ